MGRSVIAVQVPSRSLDPSSPAPYHHRGGNPVGCRLDSRRANRPALGWRAVATVFVVEGSQRLLVRVPVGMSAEATTVEVYWRPGCGACRAMRVTLAEAGVAATWHNIWEDRDASAFVRSVASGNETVPTLLIDGRAHVAPSPRRALGEISRAAPHLVRRTNRWPPLRIVQWPHRGPRRVGRSPAGRTSRHQGGGASRSARLGAGRQG